MGDADSSAILNSKQASGFAVSTNSDVLCVEAFPDQPSDQQTDKPTATSASATSNRSAFAARQQLKRKFENTTADNQVQKGKKRQRTEYEEDQDSSDDERHRKKKEPRMTTNKMKVGSRYYEDANVKNRNREKAEMN